MRKRVAMSSLSFTCSATHPISLNSWLAGHFARQDIAVSWMGPGHFLVRFDSCPNVSQRVPTCPQKSDFCKASYWASAATVLAPISIHFIHFPHPTDILTMKSMKSMKSMNHQPWQPDGRSVFGLQVLFTGPGIRSDGRIRGHDVRGSNGSNGSNIWTLSRVVPGSKDSDCRGTCRGTCRYMSEFCILHHVSSWFIMLELGCGAFWKLLPFAVEGTCFGTGLAPRNTERRRMAERRSGGAEPCQGDLQRVSRVCCFCCFNAGPGLDLRLIFVCWQGKRILIWIILVIDHESCLDSLDAGFHGFSRFECNLIVNTTWCQGEAKKDDAYRDKAMGGTWDVEHCWT